MARLPQQLRQLELRDNLNRERSRLKQLVDGLLELEQRLSNSGETVEAAALRLHSFYTGVERMLLLVRRVVNSGKPSQGEGGSSPFAKA